jgi:cytosine/uracil/thiamine/allantoin permease
LSKDPAGEAGLQDTVGLYPAFKGIDQQAIVYDYVALHITYTIIRVVLLCVALACWILYLHETWWRSGKIQTHWLKRALANLLLMLSIAIITFLVFTLMNGFESASQHRR